MLIWMYDARERGRHNFFMKETISKKESNGAQSDELNAIALINEVCVNTIYSLHGLTSKHKKTQNAE